MAERGRYAHHVQDDSFQERDVNGDQHGAHEERRHPMHGLASCVGHLGHNQAALLMTNLTK